MDIKYKTLIYPYNRTVKGLIKYQELLDGLEVEAVVIPKGWGEKGEVIKSISGKSIVVKDDFEEEILRCDVVWFVEDGICSLPEKLLKDKIEKTAEMGKKFIFSRHESIFMEKYNMDLLLAPNCREKQIEIKYTNRLIPNDVPVIVVASDFKTPDKAEIEIALRYELQKKGYNVSSIFSFSGGEYMGGHSFPDFMNDQKKSESDKIILYNHNVRLIAADEKPDVFIVGIPGEVLPYSNTIHNEFGIRTFEITNAISSDFTVLCTIYREGLLEELDTERQMLFEKYGLNVECIHLSPYIWDVQDDVGNQTEGAVLETDKKFLYDHVSELDKKDIWNLSEYKNIQIVTNKIIELLS